jgi:DNA processing protein
VTGSAAALLGGDASKLSESTGIRVDDIERLLTATASSPVRLAATRDLTACRRRGIRMLLKDDPGFPPLLSATAEPPLAIWVWGQLHPLDVFSVAVLGSSRCSAYGKAQAQRFSRAFAEHGLCIVTGGEKGIDTHVIHAALAAKGRVLIAMGAGLFEHPHFSDGLFEEIVESGRGAIISSAGTRSEPDVVNQVLGDYLVTGLSLGTLIVEAGPQSGPMIAARIAAEQTDRQLFALPGRVDSANSQGTLRLLLERRARMAIAPEDVLNLLVGAAHDLAYRIIRSRPAVSDTGRAYLERDPFRLPIGTVQEAALQHLDEPQSVPEIAERTQQKESDVRAGLYQLALAGVVTRVDDTYQRVNA